MGLALITGASSGIGFQLAKQFATHGYDVVVAAEDDGIHGAAAELSHSGTDVTPVQADLRTPDSVETLYQQAADGGRQLDAAALNAGLGTGRSFVDGDLEDNLSIVDLNVRSTVHLAKVILAEMVRRDAGQLRLLRDSVKAAAGRVISVPLDWR